MNRTETIRILAVLKAAYPHAFKDMTKTDGEAMLALWEQMFEEETYEQVNSAVGALIAVRKEGFSPTIGEVKDQIYKLRTKVELDENSAWALVSKACRNGSYHSVEEFNKLPPEVQVAVGSPDMLKQWAAMESETVESVVSSTFKRAYRTQAERAKEVSKLPPQIRQMLGGMVDKFKMIEGD